MTAKELTLYLLMSAGGLVGVRWGVLGIIELVRGVNAVRMDRPESEGSDEQ